jgi:hypothetical protein
MAEREKIKIFSPGAALEAGAAPGTIPWRPCRICAMAAQGGVPLALAKPR